MRLADDDDRPLGSLLDEWHAARPPEGFSGAVIRAFEAERRVRSSRWAPRGVVIPLLLAALFISWGAAAAFNRLTTRLVPATRQSVAEEPVKVAEARRLSFYGSAEPGSAEPDPLIESTRNARPPASVGTSALEVEVLQPQAATPPRVVHFPRCECGTSGVVCTCSE